MYIRNIAPGEYGTINILGIDGEVATIYSRVKNMHLDDLLDEGAIQTVAKQMVHCQDTWLEGIYLPSLEAFVEYAARRQVEIVKITR